MTNLNLSRDEVKSIKALAKHANDNMDDGSRILCQARKRSGIKLSLDGRNEVAELDYKHAEAWIDGIIDADVNGDEVIRPYDRDYREAQAYYHRLGVEARGGSYLSEEDSRRILARAA